MKRIIFLSLFVSLLISACRDPEIGVCESDACFDLSDLETESNYYLPFILYSDKNVVFEKVTLNGEEIDLSYGESYEFPQTGFFELILKKENETETIIFTLGTEEREHAEWGIETWTPKPFTVSDDFNGEVQVIRPQRIKSGMDVPVIFYLRENSLLSEEYFTASSSQGEFYIKRGVGSVSIPADHAGSEMNFQIANRSLSLTNEFVTEYTHELGGLITEAVTIPQNSVVHISEELNIGGPEGSLQIGAGSLVLIDEGVSIHNDNAAISIEGTMENPILITCSESGKYWGGFISGFDGYPADISARYTIFSRSGYHASGEFATWGHAKRQGLFGTHRSNLSVENCWMIDHIGQIFYPISSNLLAESILVQRVKTSGQLNYTTSTISNSIFTDFPNDNYEYVDEDNDGLYINYSDVTIDNCTFMFAKDDGIDSGGDQGGTVTVTDSRIEACFHEGAALSSKGEVEKAHIFNNCVFYNCGQGLEMGFSSPNHSVTANNCRFISNGIGIRYGDNYNWSSVMGHMYINNSQSLENSRDVWNMVRNLWAPRLENMHFDNLQVSAIVPQYPELEVIGK